MKTLAILTLSSFLFFSVSAQDLPKVFLLGEYESNFDKLTNEHNDMLLTACNNDMTEAFRQWQGMLFSMEEHAELMNYDLKGGKMWFNIFWNPDGKIKHIAYHLKPNSRNIDQEKLQLFLISFINDYNMPLAYNKKFAHYGSASFPVMPIRGISKASNKKENSLARENQSIGN